MYFCGIKYIERERYEKVSDLYNAHSAILTGCNGDEKAAQARLDKARAMYENNEFFGAKNEIDSIRTLYPKEVKVLKQGLTLMRQVEVKEAERNIAFCDSLLPIKLEEVEGLKKGFAFEKDSVYEEIGNYIWKQQTIERNVQRCYVRCGVNEEGEIIWPAYITADAPSSIRESS